MTTLNKMVNHPTRPNILERTFHRFGIHSWGRVFYANGYDHCACSCCGIRRAFRHEFWDSFDPYEGSFPHLDWLNVKPASPKVIG